MTAITYKQLREDASIRTYIIRADESLLALGFTEHSFAHCHNGERKCGAYP